MKIKLREPYWGAWKRYGWEKGVPAYSIKKSLLLEAINQDQEVIVEYKGASYRLNMDEFKKWYGELEEKPQFEAKGTTLVCIPKFLYDEL